MYGGGFIWLQHRLGFVLKGLKKRLVKTDEGKRDRVRRSGLWNSIHVDETYAPDFLDTLRRLVDRMR